MPNQHDKLVEFISDKYYKGGMKDDISKKILSDQSAYNKALEAIHKDKYGSISYDEFKAKYESKYGNPYEVKKKSVPETPYDPSQDVLLNQLQAGSETQSTPSGSGSSEYNRLIFEKPEFIDNTVASESTGIAPQPTPETPQQKRIRELEQIARNTPMGSGIPDFSTPGVDNTVASESTNVPLPTTPKIEEPVNIRSVKDFKKGENQDKLSEPFSFGKDVAQSFKNIVSSNKQLPKKIDLFIGNATDKVYKSLESMGVNTSGLQALTLANQIGNLYEIDKEAINIKPTSSIVDAIEEGNVRKTAAAIVGGVFSLSDSMVKAIATGGTSVFAQAIAENYYNTLQETAELAGTTPLSIIMKDEDKELVPLITGTISGALEKIGLDKVGATWLKKAPMGVWKKVIEVAKTSGVEGTTEALQEITDQVGTRIANGKSIDVAWREVLESGLIGLTSGGVMGGAGSVARGRGANTESNIETVPIPPSPQGEYMVDGNISDKAAVENAISEGNIGNAVINNDPELEGKLIDKAKELEAQATTQENAEINEQSDKKTEINPGEERVVVEDGSKEPDSKRVGDKANQGKTIRRGNNEYTVKKEGNHVFVYDKEGNEPSAVTQRKVLRQYEEEFDYTEGEVSKDPDGDIAFDINMIDDHVAETSNNPAEIAETWQQSKAYQDTEIDYKTQIISDNLPKIERQSFIDNVDKNEIRMSIAKTYLRKDGVPMDVAAQELSEIAGIEITEQDIWEYMREYPNGYKSIKHTEGQKKLQDKFSELTGLELNQRTANLALKSKAKKEQIEYENYINQEFYEQAQAELEFYNKLKTDEKLQKEYFRQETPKREPEASSPAESQTEVEQREGRGEQAQRGPISERFRAKNENQEEVVKEIQSLPLTHVSGLNMGANQAKGTYVSTEPINRYKDQGGQENTVEVSIEKPFVFESEDGIVEYRNDLLNSNLDKFEDADFVSLDKNSSISQGELSIDDLSDAGIIKLAEMVSNQLTEDGYDSIYFRESPTQEGELVVFDKDKVKLTPVEKSRSKKTDTTKRGGKQVTFKDPMGITSKPLKGKVTGEVKDASGKVVSYKIKSEDGTNYTVKAKDIDYGEVLSGDKLYSMPIGTQSKSIGRINPDPIIGEKPKMLKDIVLDLSKGIKSKIYYTKSPSSRRALGSYNPRNAAIAIKFNNDLDVTAHELGHSLDDKFGIQLGVSDEIIKELKPFYKFGSKPPKGHHNPTQYRIGEGIAEWIRAYIVNPEEAKNQAPLFYQWYKSKVPVATQKLVNDFSNDIRIYAGSTAHEQIMSNVQWDPEKQKGGIIDALWPKSTQKDNFEITWGDNLNTKWLNSLHPFEKAVEFAKGEKGITEVLPENDPKVAARLLLGINEKFDNIIKHGLVDSRNERIKDGNNNMTLEWLISPLDNTDAKTIETEAQEVISYMIAERTVELGNRFDRESILTGIGGGIYRDIDTANKRFIEFNDLKSSNPDKHARILEASRRYREYSDKVLRYMTDKGRMSEKAYNEIKRNNIQYVALNRILEAAPDEEIISFKGDGGGSLASITNPIHKIKGSTKTIKNPYSSLLDFAYKGIREADRNEVMLTFRDFFTENRGMYEGSPNKLSQIARKAGSSDKNTVKIFVDGKEEYWQLQEDVYKALKNITDAGYKFPALMTALPKLLRWTVTNFPVFALRNRIRDFQHRLVVSKTKAYKGYDIYTRKGVKSEIKNKFQIFGGGQSGYYLKDDNFYKTQMDYAIKNLSKSKNTIIADPKLLANYVWDKYQGIIQSSETIGRLEEFRSAYKIAKKKGLDNYNASLYAAYEARDLMDFAVAGTYMREVNKLIPFSNAAVQGLRKTFRTASEDPLGFSVRWVLYSAIPSMLIRVLIDSLDKEEEYQQLPAYQRDLFYNIPVSDNLWISIPKPFEIGVFGSGTERLLDYALYGNKKAFEGYGGILAEATLPVSESDLAGPLQSFVEVMANYDFFRQKNIISPHESGKDLSLRKTERASRIGNTLQKVFGVDGRYIDHLIQSNMSYYGNFILKLSDIGKEDAKHQFNWSDLGVFKQTPVYNSRDVQWVMTNAKSFNLLQSREYKHMNALISEYFEAKSNKEKEIIGKEIREYAAYIREFWEEADFKRK